jgi:hypothetical protein
VIPRQIFQTNTRLEFQTNNLSYHPVFGRAGCRQFDSAAADGSVISCVDCHT